MIGLYHPKETRLETVDIIFIGWFIRLPFLHQSLGRRNLLSNKSTDLPNSTATFGKSQLVNL